MHRVGKSRRRRIPANLLPSLRGLLRAFERWRTAMRRTISLVLLLGALSMGLAACGADPATRAVTGGLIGAGVGAGVAAVTGGKPATGALVGAGVGAVGGAVTAP